MEEAIAEIESIVSNGYNENRFKDIEQAFVAILKSESVSQEQLMRVFNIGVDMILQGYPLLAKGLETYNFIVGLLQDKGFVSPFEDRYSKNMLWEHPGLETVTQLFREVIERITPDTETVEYIEMAQVAFGGPKSTRLREGFLVVTQNRVFSVGYEFMVETSYTPKKYLYYPDLETQPHYGSLDYFEREKITNVQLNYGRRDKNVEITLHDIRYFIRKPRYFLGPLFFKSRLSDTVKLEQGPFKIVARISRPTNQNEGAYKKRYETLREVLSGVYTL